MVNNKFVCKICGGIKHREIYFDPIRTGKFGSLSKENYSLYQCDTCGVIALPLTIKDLVSYYETESYREEFDGSSGLNDYFKLHDSEQLRNLSIIGTSIFRDKIVADVGCAGGLFLDSIKGYAKLTIAIEPSTLFRDSLKERGYIVYPYVKDALNDYENKVDLVVSFSVIEHLEEPLSFLQGIYRLLSPNGKLILSTPNADDILLHALPEVYPKFFYRKAHFWYFNSTALTKILEIAGFKKIKIIPYHRFGLANFLIWLKDKVPRGEIKMVFVTDVMDAVWKAELERIMRCDYLYAEASVDKRNLIVK